MSDDDRTPPRSSTPSPWRSRRGAGSRAESGSSSGSDRRGKLAPPLFAPDTVISNRYRVIEFLGRGGMGEVYEAEDLDLEVRVALKTVRPEIADNEKALDRFRREIQLARKVTHPNVCRIFDVGYHIIPPDGSGSEDDSDREIVFLTMELLEGETLSTRLKREGHMTTVEAMPIVEQIAAALAAAHAAGIMHRDFKSTNIILVPVEDGSTGVRAVVTDFGLARGFTPGDPLTTSLSVSTQPVGTPTYMAPEQVAGRELTPLVDIYALGVVIYEMLTGTPPFVGDSPLSTAVKRLVEVPRPPRDLVPSIEPEWERAILGCLERDPERRYPSALDVVRVIRGEILSAEQARPSFIRPLVITLVAVIAVAAVSFLVTKPDAEAPEPKAAPTRIVEPRPSVAIIGFRNLSNQPESAWVSTALSEMLGTEIAVTPSIRVIPGENVARMRKELVIEADTSMGNETLSRIGRNLGANLLVHGSYLVVHDSGEELFRVDIRLHDAGGETQIATFSETAREGDLLDLVSNAGKRLRSLLGAAELSMEETDAIASSRPTNVESARLYALGLEKLSLSDAMGARDAFEDAVSADPENPLIHSALSRAWTALGYDERAAACAKRALDHSASLSRRDQLVVEGRFRVANREWDRAIEIYRSLWNFFPDDLEYGLSLAQAQSEGGNGVDALETVRQLQRLPDPARNDPRIDMAEARAAESLSDFRREIEAAGRAAAKAESLEAWILVGEAKLAEWWAHRNLGNLEEAIEASSEAKRIFSSVLDRGALARALNAEATVARQLGRFKEADRLDEESLQVFREIGDRKRESWALNNAGRGRLEEGEIGAALARFEESLALAREIGDRSGVARALGNIGNIHLDLGRITDASTAFEEASSIGRELGEARTVAWSLYNQSGVFLASGEVDRSAEACREALEQFETIGERRGTAWTRQRLAEIAVARGDVDDALREIQESLKIFRETQDTRGVHFSLDQLGRVRFHRGELEEAVTALGESLAIREKHGDRWNAALSRLMLAQVAIERGEREEAIRRIDEARLELREEDAVAVLALADTIEAHARLDANDEKGALERIRRAQSAPLDPRNRMLSLQIRVVAGLIAVGSKDRARLEAMRRDLESVIAEARTGGYGELGLRARIVLGRIETALGHTASGTARIDSAREEARKKNLNLVARLGE